MSTNLTLQSNFRRRSYGGPSVAGRGDVLGPEDLAEQGAQRDREDAGARGDPGVTEEMVAAGRRLVREIGRLREDDLRAESAVQRIRAERARVDRTGDDLPERIEVGERRPRRVVVVSRGVMHVSGQPDRVADLALLELAQHPGDLVLTTTGRTRQTVRDRLDQLAIGD